MVFLACATAYTKTSNNRISGLQWHTASENHDFSTIHLIYAIKSSAWLSQFR